MSDIGPFMIDGVPVYRAFIRLQGEDSFEVVKQVASQPTLLWGFKPVSKGALLASQVEAKHYHVDFPGFWTGENHHDKSGLDFWFRSKQMAIMCKLAVIRPV